ncbi:c-type cytochrome [Salibacteraceae bacterium]|nr:c-type cytochrome [Salibacteraceae bacterium]
MKFKKNRILPVLAVGLVMASCAGSDEADNADIKSDLKESARYDDMLSKEMTAFAALPVSADNPENKSSSAKIKLGHALYFDTRLSLTGNNSCNSCHNLDSYGVDNLPTSPGDAGENGDRNSPTTLNAALHVSQFWDGRMKDVEEQAGGPVLNPVEMNMPSEAEVEKRLSSVEIYKEMFAAAYPEDANPFTYTNMRNAIGVFERQLLTPSRVDAYIKGDKQALTLKEKKGMLSFSYIGCTTCHNGSLLGGNQLQRFGVHKPYWEATGSANRDGGLYEQTKDSFDLYMFKVPSLRNISETYPYFHDGSVSDLGEAVKIMADVQLDYKMNKSEVQNVVAFLQALKGEVPAQYKENPLAANE